MCMNSEKDFTGGALSQFVKVRRFEDYTGRGSPRRGNQVANRGVNGGEEGERGSAPTPMPQTLFAEKGEYPHCKFSHFHETL